MQFPKSKKKEDEGAKAAKLKEEQRQKSVNKQKTKRMKSYCLARILMIKFIQTKKMCLGYNYKKQKKKKIQKNSNTKTD